MGGVFVNYRTRDGEWPARMIAKELAARFGDNRIFYASTCIPPGADFASEIRRRVVGSDVLLAVIGNRWLAREDGQRKIDDPDDWVRREIRIAFENDVRVIPVLVDDAPRLTGADLPDDIAKLERCQYLHVRHRDRNDAFAVLADELTRLLPADATEPWRVCVRDTGGDVRGAGVVLGGQYVLTCAHVLTDVDDEVVVEFVGLRDARESRARVVREWCVWPRANQRGDVALLRLVQRQPSAVGANLRMMALTWDRNVRVCGFPRGLETGVYTRAVLAGNAGPGGEWLQMNARSPGEQRVRAGFSGAGVVDELTGDVVGIVVGEYTDAAANLSWMIPVETILDHLPRVREWVTGGEGTDKVFSEPPDRSEDLLEPARTLSDWLTRRDSGDRLFIVEGPETAAMPHAVSLSSRRHPGVPEPVPAGVDLAIDASGRTADEVARRVLDRSGTPLASGVRPTEQLRSGLPPMTIVITGVDDAHDPNELLGEVFKPLLEQGSRLALGFRDSSSPALALARSWHFNTATNRLDRLARRIGEIETVERTLMELRRHIRDDGPVDYRGGLLAMALAQIREIDASGESDDVLALLDRCERKAARVLRRVTKTREQLRDDLGDRDALRGELAAYQAKAGDDGLGEDLDVAAAYRAARGLLWQAPTDVNAAREAMRRYRLAIRAAAKRPGEGRQ